MTALRVQILDDAANDGRGAWQLTDPLVYQSDAAGTTFTVPPGFTTDFASVPRIPLIYEATGDSAHMGAVIHDYLYTLVPHPTDRAMADLVLREAAIVSGVPGWRAWMIWIGVRIGGASHWN